MTKGCDEKIDWEFIRWILWDGRTWQRRASIDVRRVSFPKRWL